MGALLCLSMLSNQLEHTCIQSMTHANDQLKLIITYVRWGPFLFAIMVSCAFCSTWLNLFMAFLFHLVESVYGICMHAHNSKCADQLSCLHIFHRDMYSMSFGDCNFAGFDVLCILMCFYMFSCVFLIETAY
jgi:hypothetical protein